MENAHIIKKGSAFQLLSQHWHCNGRLNHIIFLFRCLVVVAFCLMFCWYYILCLYPAFVSASLYGLIQFLNIFSLADNCDILNSNDFGSCLIMGGGDWILCSHNSFCSCLSGKDGTMSFPNSK